MQNVLAGLRHQLEVLFATELAGLSAAEVRVVVDALDLATSFQTWDFLRFEHGYSVARASAAVRRNVAAVLRDAGVSV